MVLILAAEAQPGMVLAADVTDRHGRLLIPSGNPLEERHLSSLRSWGVQEIEVEDGTAGIPGILPKEHFIEQARQEVLPRFAGSDTTHPFLKGLLEAAVMERAGELARERSRT
ncbi:MAG: hypothetical protein OEZ65_12545 [Gemmatimonadota bacterium]|nr:hypothetical protein [Gemmatimonadota bacterium]MDH5760409.1 hypothetical protein [Gemmatimonadota bacterium]